VARLLSSSSSTTNRAKSDFYTKNSSRFHAEPLKNPNFNVSTCRLAPSNRSIGLIEGLEKNRRFRLHGARNVDFPVGNLHRRLNHVFLATVLNFEIFRLNPPVHHLADDAATFFDGGSLCGFFGRQDFLLTRETKGRLVIVQKYYDLQ